MGAAKQKQGKGGGGNARANAASHLLVLGVAMFVISWFVPVVRGQELFGGFSEFTQQLGAKPEAGLAGVGSPDWLPGWWACQVAWHLLVDSDLGGGEEWRQRLAGSSCLTNGIMVLVVLAALLKLRRRWHGVLLLGCAAVNASWIYLSDRNPVDAWAAGYWLWLASFVLAGLGLMSDRERAP
jgi:hypothetical protein